jgi:hypothetical protein
MVMSREYGLSARRWSLICLVWLLVLTSGTSAWAQGKPPENGLPSGGQRGDGAGRGREGRQRPEPISPLGDPNFGFLASEMRWGGKTVKGAPYSAQAISEHTQTLSNGTQIRRQSTAQIYRDSEGRTRHEETPTAFGTFAAMSETSPIIFINDPVAKVQYLLNPRDHTASKISTPGNGPPPYQPPSSSSSSGRSSSPDGPEPSGKPSAFGKQESLGKQMIEGVEAEGTRLTLTIPTGQIGNDRPIDIVSERWYSPALQMVVRSKHTDPRLGETVYRLANINRDDPPRALFEVPADYKLKSNDPHRGPDREWRERK